MLSIIFLPIIFCIGIVTSYEDLRLSKIRNVWILFGVLYALFINSLTWLFYYNFVQAESIVFLEDKKQLFLLISFFDKWGINLLVTTIIAYLLWHFKIWGGGDAKLFICYASLIPISKYSKVYFNYYFASFLLLIYIFIPVTIFLLIKALIYCLGSINLKESNEISLTRIKININRKKITNFLKTASGFFILFFILDVVRQYTAKVFNPNLLNQNLLAVILLLGFNQISTFFRNNFKIMIICFVILYVFLKTQTDTIQLKTIHFRIISLKSLFIVILYSLSRKLISIFNERTLKKTTPFAPWMFLGALLTWFL